MMTAEAVRQCCTLRACVTYDHDADKPWQAGRQAGRQAGSTALIWQQDGSRNMLNEFAEVTAA